MMTSWSSSNYPLPSVMAASSKPTEHNWHPSSLLPYDALPNRQDDFDLIMSSVKSTAGTGTDFYDRSLTSRRYAFVGVAFSTVISCCCITTGIVIMANRGVCGAIPLFEEDSRLSKEMQTFTLNSLVMICTESTGFVHSISLRSALALESRLRFNTNLRLLTAARGWRNPNGALLNGIMAVLLILSYSSASVVLYNDFKSTSRTWLTAIAGLPLLLLGVALFLQVVIALSGVRAVKILTWSSSPFDLTPALIHHTQLTPVSFRCMRGVSDVYGGPAKPSESQLSAWLAHPSIRKVVISLWGLVVACALWAALITCRPIIIDPPVPMQWTFLPDGNYTVVYMSERIGFQWGLWSLINIAVIQGPLTLGLHCSELIANVIQNERQWRRATSRKGLQAATSPLKLAFANPLGLVIFAVKPILHWMFGLALGFDGWTTNASYGSTVVEFGISMYSTQIWNLCIALFIFAIFFTLVALRRPRGPQPATYGHLQTLANLVDEWSPVMWWGHKEDGIPYCHAGRVLV
ncbi:uncharacterized protein EDB91DRAFT_369145 [Suillus paluster]|uniref:uncharacterized protein n=1 Tax=Suillus paluster TaxID=48578 RepID=UPI001B86D0B7|nr:uncharacterized protein EDB91DRAFT_369145 [Suillus paluster]KAG1739831.1 hypothetical protein EDB91DRAFT_369145 [Suillus paluster]